MEEILKDILNSINDNEKLDLSKKEDVQKFHDEVNKLRKNDSLLDIMQLFGYDLKNSLDVLDKFADKLYAESKEDNNTDNFERPSSKLTMEQGLQIHEIVREYVDTMIRPYNKGVLTTKQINDVYAGLYEFAAWVINKK